jgi:hypothetical protein
VLVVEMVLRDVDDGITLSTINETINSVPQELADLFTALFRQVHPKRPLKSLVLIQWTLVSQ